MNKLIKDLWTEAGGSYDMGNQHSWPKYTITDLEKFAGLLIRHAADVADQYVRDGDIDIAELIRRHFGIEKDKLARLKAETAQDIAALEKRLLESKDEDEIEYCPTCGEEWSGTSCGANYCGWITNE